MMEFKWITLLYDFMVILLAFIVHELTHVLVAKRLGIFKKLTPMMLFGKIPIGATTWITGDATLDEQIKVTSAGVYTGLPFIFLAPNKTLFFIIYVFASIHDFIQVIIMSYLILFRKFDRNMTIKEAMKKVKNNG